MFARPKRPTHTIDMAPLIDVVFLLLIFFMLTSSFTRPSLPLELPKAAAGETRPAEAVEVSLDVAGALMIDGEAVTAEAFDATLRQRLEKAGTQIVNFRGDRGVDYGRFVDLMARARQVGATQFNLVHDPAAP